MKPMTPKRTRRLRARAAAMNAPDDEYEDYGPEPNMKLSHAFLVVLLLHVIAVGGLYAFTTMKASKTPKSAIARVSAPAATSADTLNREQSPDQPPPSSQPPTQNESQGQPPNSGGEGPEGGKPPLVTKGIEAPKGVKKNAAQPITQTAGLSYKGILASIRNAMAKAAGFATTAGGVGHAVAQDASNATVQETNTSAPADTVAGKTYMVRAGDTITRIASSLGVSISDLEKANGLMGNAVLQVGQILKVPETVLAQTANSFSSQAGKIVQGAQQLPGSIASTASAVTGATPAPAQTEYTVVKGDSPYKIAKHFKISPDALMKANSITDPKKIQIGQKLVIPPSSKKPTP